MSDPAEAWFLTPEERGNNSTDIDRRRGDGLAFTRGNLVEALVHGREYFSTLHEELRAADHGTFVHFTDWRGDSDERLDGPGTEVGRVLADLARRGVAVRGLVWRSHPDQIKFNEQENIRLTKVINEAGGEVLLDQRVRRGGSHHQKLFVIRHPGDEDRDVAFVGGIDLCHGRGDDERHLGDEQAIELDKRYGPRPAWHDVQLRIRGPAIGDLATTFRERWEDPTPLDHRNPWRMAIARATREPRKPGPLPPMPKDPAPVGSHSVQVLRTYPAKRPPFPFAPRGERSVARGYSKAFARARSLIYIEDQYLWSDEIAELLAASLRRAPELRLIVVLPRYPDRDGLLSGPPYRTGRREAVERVVDAGPGRVAIYDLENEAGRPIYVHAKVCVIDDVWVAVGSDNLNRRSWTNDSELTCAVVDETRDAREPADPGGRGEGARRFARELRLRLWREHLGRGVPDEDLLDPVRGFEVWERSAKALDDWVEAGRRGPRPAGRARPHDAERIPAWARWWARPIYRVLVDPDGRPAALRSRRRF